MHVPGMNRRQLLRSAACGFGSLALAGLCADESPAARLSPFAERPTHFPARAKRVIFIFMQGGPSQVDTWDYKPQLAQRDGQAMQFDVARTRKVSAERVLKSPWKFQQHGQSGHWASELFPHMVRHVDDCCQIRSMHTEGVAHGPATLFLHTGATNLIRPSVGAWVTYGLGTENQDLPGFLVLCPSAAKGGPRNYANAFLPTHYQGTVLGRAGVSVQQANFRHITNERVPLADQREQLRFLQALNREQAGTANDDQLEATIDSFELAFRMQQRAPGIMDLSGETAATLQQYGIGESATDDFGRQCLLARRFAEAGVRFVQINYGDNTATPRWDQHSKDRKSTRLNSSH